jgi:uncharacterized repeat protein (TIGR01451 family)
VVDRYAPALSADSATGGFRLEEGAITWTVDVPPGPPTRLRVLCVCQTATTMTCNRVTVILPDGTRLEGESCLEILPAPAPPAPPAPPPALPIPSAADDLSLSVIGLHNPVKVGKELTYEIQVVNQGMASYRGLRVTATLPDGMMPVALGTVGPDHLRSQIDGQTIRFDPIAIAAGAALHFDVRALAVRPGRLRVTAEMTAPGLGVPRRQEAVTEVIDPK